MQSLTSMFFGQQTWGIVLAEASYIEFKHIRGGKPCVFYNLNEFLP